MPYVTQTRRRNALFYPVKLTGLKGVDETVRSEGAFGPYDDLETVYTYRSQGTDDSGNSLRYDDLPGEVLRSEAMMQSKEEFSGDTGHTFWKTTSFGRRFPFTEYRAVRPSGVDRYTYEGLITPSSVTSDYAVTVIPPPSSNSLNLLGTRAVKRFDPGSPPISLLTSLAELYREGFPKLAGIRAVHDEILKFRLQGTTMGTYRDANTVPSDFLSYQFGLKPLGNDIAGVASLVIDASEMWRRYEELAKRQIRRKGVLEEDSSVSVGTLGSRTIGMQRRAPNGSGAESSAPFFFPSPGCEPTWTELTRTKVWFSGCWTWYLESSGHMFTESRLRKAQHLLGLEITPEVVYNLAPWSWLFDWFANLGDIISNISSLMANSQVLRYGYLMREVSRERILSAPALQDYSGQYVGPFSATIRSVRKDRVRANPYGFGVDTSLLTGTQWAILSALGMTRAPKTLLNP